MKFSLICIGKTKQTFVQEGINFYLKRISKYMKIDFQEIVIPNKLIAKNSNESRNNESNYLQNYMKGNEFLILLDETGIKYGSEKFAGFIQQILNNEQRNIVFAIGGAYGFSEEIKKK